MKINHTQGLNPVNPYKNQISHRPESAPQEKGGKRDVVDISKEAFQLQGDPTSTDRTQKVDALKAQIDAGQYQVNHKAVAEKMIAFWQKAGGRE